MKKLIASLLTILITPALNAAPLELKPGDQISVIGNTTAELLQHHGWLETLLHARFPQHKLVVRHLGFSADTLNVRLRSANFGSTDEWLTRTGADVVFAFFGYNESFEGEAGLEQFKKDLAQFLQHTLEQKYHGSAPRLVLFGPLAHENLHSPDLPDGNENNARLKLYTAAMAEVAQAAHVPFVDLYAISQQAFEKAGPPNTLNGIHLTPAGEKRLAPAIDAALFGGAARSELAALEKLHAAVLDKNWHWFHRYRTTDGFSIYGGRADTPTNGQKNREVMAREMEVLDVLTANRDRRIWAVAAGGEVALDDSNTPPFIPVKTNKPGPNPDGTFHFLGGEEAIGKMTIDPRLRVNLFASEEQFPELINPVQMAFDTRGRLWVATWPSYPHWKPKDKMDDRLLILEDTDGDGRADRSKIFAGGLHNPTGFEFWGGGVLVAMAPDLLFLRDTDGDDVADERTAVIHGLDSADTHHTSNSFTLDPGGALYFQEGTFHHTQVETPWGPPRRVANGAVFRYEPRAQKFDVYVSHGFANPHGHVFDRWGQDIVIDGTGAVPYHGALFSGHVDFPTKHARPPSVYQQRTRPCPGLEILSSRHFPEDWQAHLLVPNVIGFQGILRYKILDNGASFAAEEQEPLVSSSDENFRPADVELAPDGSIYFTDWQNPIIGHLQHNLRDPNRDKIHGRVYRITYKDRPLLTPRPVSGEPIERLLDLLREPEDRVRCRARIELSARDPGDVLKAAQRWSAALDKQDPQYEQFMLETLWLHQNMNVVSTSLLNRMLASPDFHARAAATRVLGYWRDRVSSPLELLRKQAADEHPRVRLEAVRAASFFTEPEAVEVVLIAADQKSDPFVEFVVGETMKTLEPYVKRALAAGQPIAMTSDSGARYLLRNTSTEQLLAMPHKRPVCLELLYRPGLRDEQRREILSTLAELSQRDELAELLEAVRQIDRKAEDRDQSIVFDLLRLLSGRSTTELSAVRNDLEQLAISAQQPIIRQAAYVAIVGIDGTVDRAWQLAGRSAAGLSDLLGAMPAMPDASLRAALYPLVEPLLRGLPAKLAGGSSSSSGSSLPDLGGGRYVRIELPGNKRTLTLAEVEVLSGGRNVARSGKASQKSTSNSGDARRAIDGNKQGSFGAGGQTHSQENTANPWWEVDLGQEYPIDSITVYNRTDGDLGKRLDKFTLLVLDRNRRPIFRREQVPAPKTNVKLDISSTNPATIVRRGAMNALASVRGQETHTFDLLADFVRRDVDRASAISALQRIARSFWPKEQARPLLDLTIGRLRSTPPAERTSTEALEAMEFAEALANLLPADEARRARADLEEIGVRVIRLGTVLERMAYDQDVIAVRAGKPVEIIFENADMMPHNLIIALPGAMEELGVSAESQAQQPAFAARGYVPQSKKILLSSRLLQPRDSEKLSFNVPQQPGVYPFVCTYPGHWRRMYGALYVVENLDEYLANPDVYLAAHRLPIKDPLLADRRPRTEWKLADLGPAVEALEHGRSYGNGKQMFQVANCVACHKLDGVGNAFGPDLAKLEAKWQPLDVVKEMLEPSARINEKFQTYIFVTTAGQTITGMIIEETPTMVRVIENPLAKTQPIELKRADIEAQQKSPVSLMPKGLLDKLSRDEILDLVAYIASRGDKNHPLFHAAGHHHGH